MTVQSETDGMTVQSETDGVTVQRQVVWLFKVRQML